VAKHLEAAIDLQSIETTWWIHLSWFISSEYLGEKSENSRGLGDFGFKIDNSGTIVWQNN
jgi:hypothetical protein